MMEQQLDPAIQSNSIPDSPQVVSNPVPSLVRSIDEAIVIKDGNLFFLSHSDGSVPLEGRHGFGLYYNDCRYLNGHTLKLGTSRPYTLVSHAPREFISILQLSNEEFAGRDGKAIAKEHLGIKWTRVLDGKELKLEETLVFQNFSVDPLVFDATLTFDATFEDVFTVRGLISDRQGVRSAPQWSDRTLSFIYTGSDQIYRRLCIEFFPAPTRHDGLRAHYEIDLASQENHQIDLHFSVEESEKPFSTKQSTSPRSARPVPSIHTGYSKVWLTKEAKVESDSQSLNRTIRRSFRDLRMLESSHKGQTFFSAGIPWFATLFGRDSIITAIQTLAYNPVIAEQTLRLLALHQGKTTDEWRDETPGKILHELRFGELARSGQIPHTPYYGTIDATPLFLILVARHAQWTGDLQLFRQLERSVQGALRWIEDFGNLDGGGYLKYSSRSSRGLSNQGWKDSWDGIMNADGSLAEPPIALVEAQGYVYDAKLGIAELYEREGQGEMAARLRNEAEKLRERFNRDFWLEKEKCYALALQGNGDPLRVVSSNPGHALWSGIADPEKAKLVADRLMEADMFCGWGIRTLSERERRYNPLGYHLGTVWPHDNAIIASGFKRYGFTGKALQIFDGMFRSSIYFDGQRLPELFAGFSEEDYGVPVHYPVACHPQAWAAGTIPHLLETLLGLSPDGFSKRLRVVDPVLPDIVDRLEFRELRVGDATVDLGFYRTGRGSVAVEILKLEGQLHVVVEPVAPAVNN